MIINFMILLSNFLRNIHLNLTMLLGLYRMFVGWSVGFCEIGVSSPGPAQVLPRYISALNTCFLIVWNFEIPID